MGNKGNRIIGIVVGIALILILLITSIEAVVYWMPGYFQKEYEKHQVLQDVGMEMDQLLQVTDHMMAYLRGQEEELQISATIDGCQGMLFFNQREILHMVDVKALFLHGMMLRRVALTVAVVGIALLWHRKALRTLPGAICVGTGMVFAIALITTLVVAADFNHYFTVFHHIFFDNDLWLLNPATDRLIRIVPEGFFIDTAAAIITTFMAGTGILFCGCLLLHRKLYSKINENPA